VVNNQQQQLTIFQADIAGNITGATGPLQLDRSDISPAATTTVDVQANLDASAAVPTAPFSTTDATSYNNSTSLTIFDSLGSPHLSTMYFTKTANNTWDVRQFVDGTQVNTGAPAADAITFDNTGAITGGSPTSMTFTPTGGAAAMTVSVDYNNTSQFGSPFSVNALTQDGFATGRLSGIDISTTGVITSRFTNGQSRTLGQIAIATFNNSQGLRQLGDTAWAETFDSGAPLVGGPGTGAAGLIESGALEGSNVDLTAELVNMITAQRNFQANAQVITTADTVTQTIINIR